MVQTSLGNRHEHTCRVAFPCEYVDVERDSKTKIYISNQTKRFWASNPYVGEPFSAADMLALVRLLASMGSDVNCQGTSLDEALPTSGCHARVWTLIGVDSIMSLEIRLPVEALGGC